MVIIKDQMAKLELPDLPGTTSRKLDSSIISPEQFTRKKLKVILHMTTGELKSRGTKTPHIFLPFRSRIDDEKLESFLSKLFPNGELISIADEVHVSSILKTFDEFTLICGLKYLWSRLPNNEIVGWDVYLEFKRREKEAGYPRNAFLSIMPKCLSSPAHASIVYDFLDLLISIASNSQYNFLSGRKIAKMSSLWAFNGISKHYQSPFYDATINKENNFIEGLEIWKSTSDALFHLLLSFLRAMLPDNEMDTLKLPKTLQSLLITNSYPPAENTDSIKSMITIPCVLVKSTKVSSNAYELLSKARHTLSFNKKDSFLSIENYTILKNIFQKHSTSDIVLTLTEESRRILNRLTTDPIESKYDVYPGWAKNDVETDPNIPLFSQITIHDVTLQDYYIWTWLSSLGSDQTSHIKKLFGRSLVVEAGLRGFQKWLIITEQTLSSDEYIQHFNSLDLPEVPEKQTVNKHRVVSDESYKNKDMPLPPPPLPKKDSDGLLPKYNFTGEDYKLDLNTSSEYDDENSNTFIYPSNVNDNQVDDYKKYLETLNDFNEDELVQNFKDKSTISNPKSLRMQSKSSGHRPPPPPLDLSTPATQEQLLTPTLAPVEPSTTQENFAYPTQSEQNGGIVSPMNGGSEPYTTDLHYLTPRECQSPGRNSVVSQYYSPQKEYFKEPFDDYETQFEDNKEELNKSSDEPFENYYIPGSFIENNGVLTNEAIKKQDPYLESQLDHDKRVKESHNDEKYQSSQSKIVNHQHSLPIGYEKAQSNDEQQQSSHADYADYAKLEYVQGNESQLPTPQPESSRQGYQSHSPSQENVSDALNDKQEEMKLKEERKKKRKEKKKKEKEAAVTAAMYAPYVPYGYFPQGPPPGIIPPFGSNPLEILPPVPAPGFYPPGPPVIEGSPKKPKKEKKKKRKSEDPYLNDEQSIPQPERSEKLQIPQNLIADPGQAQASIPQSYEDTGPQLLQSQEMSPQSQVAKSISRHLIPQITIDKDQQKPQQISASQNQSKHSLQQTVPSYNSQSSFPLHQQVQPKLYGKSRSDQQLPQLPIANGQPNQISAAEDIRVPFIDTASIINETETSIVASPKISPPHKHYQQQQPNLQNLKSHPSQPYDMPVPHKNMSSPSLSQHQASPQQPMASPPHQHPQPYPQPYPQNYQLYPQQYPSSSVQQHPPQQSYQQHPPAPNLAPSQYHQHNMKYSSHPQFAAPLPPTNPMHYYDPNYYQHPQTNHISSQPYYGSPQQLAPPIQQAYSPVTQAPARFGVPNSISPNGSDISIQSNRLNNVPKRTTSDLTLLNMLPAEKFNKNSKTNKANLRAALNQGNFGI